jgi:hypothetical protein
MKTSNTAKNFVYSKRNGNKNFGYFLRAAMMSIPKNCDFGIVSCSKLKAEI